MGEALSAFFVRHHIRWATGVMIDELGYETTFKLQQDKKNERNGGHAKNHQTG